ncbi:acyltransferase domain-containing protein [Kitasatospora sp. NPDC089509]|uniref:acyltransferase domain-containing protein n=1 Tax=Kitasatospora sp. NPDC089509 TaxID=3364079 RepID=UPI003822EC38
MAETASGPECPIVLLLPGQGAQYPGMGTGLYRSEPEFAAAVDEVFAALGPESRAIRADWLSDRPGVPLDHAARAQPLLFAVDYALGRVLLDRGLKPAALLGHSIGEVAAAVLAGVIGLGDAARLVMDRVRHVGSAPAGGMVAVSATEREVEPYLRPGVDVAALNAPRQTVLAGPTAPLAATLEALRAAGLACAPVAATTPFHSRALEPLVEAGLRSLAGVRLRPPVVPIMSGYTAHWLGEENATSPAYWSSHPVAPVRYWPAVGALLAEGDAYLLAECGPGQGLITPLRRHPAVRSGRSRVCALLGPAGAGPAAENTRFRAASAELGLAHL